MEEITDSKTDSVRARGPGKVVSLGEEAGSGLDSCCPGWWQWCPSRPDPHGGCKVGRGSEFAGSSVRNSAASLERQAFYHVSLGWGEHGVRETTE